MGELEQAVMSALWELDDDQWATVRQVHESLADKFVEACGVWVRAIDRMLPQTPST